MNKQEIPQEYVDYINVFIDEIVWEAGGLGFNKSYTKRDCRRSMTQLAGISHNCMKLIYELDAICMGKTNFEGKE